MLGEYMLAIKHHPEQAHQIIARAVEMPHMRKADVDRLIAYAVEIGAICKDDVIGGDKDENG